eukprot:Phypoly_transcript_13884.p1 GENE.Phypoly_transcript_13884~~Phypoly_transcript_13884.p1  ORF type:complete len:272 (+),score=44.95 Phypoly_transcript_13884:50-865(+)
MRQWGGHSLAQGQSIVLVVDSKVQRGSVVEEIKGQVQNGKVDVFEQGVELSGVSNVDAVIVYGAVSGTNIDSTLTQALKALKPGGFVVLCVPNGGVSDEDASDKLMFSGFVNTKVNKVGEFSEISSSKPDWEVGASQKLNLKRPAQDTKNIWTAKATTDENDLIDEDSLLSETDRSAKPITKADDCEVGKAGKKACKNCTCGRAEEEDAGVAPPKPKLTKEMIENPGVGSNCGSCSLGDAFRCGGCPYRGLPAFKVGEKITIPDNFMADDI